MTSAAVGALRQKPVHKWPGRDEGDGTRMLVPLFSLKLVPSPSAVLSQHPPAPSHPQQKDDTIPGTEDPSTNFSEREGENVLLLLAYIPSLWLPQFSFMFNGNRILTLRSGVEQII